MSSEGCPADRSLGVLESIAVHHAICMSEATLSRSASNGNLFRARIGAKDFHHAMDTCRSSELFVRVSGKRTDVGSELELPGPNFRDGMDTRIGEDCPSLMGREPAIAYLPVSERRHEGTDRRPPSKTVWEWVKDNPGYVADAGVLVVCLIIYASLEAGHPRSTFLVSSLVYQYSYPLKVREKSNGQRHMER